MKLTQWTVFLDILGYGAVNKSIDNHAKAKELIEFLNKNKEILEGRDKVISKLSSKKGEFDLKDYYDVKFAFISDSIVISYDPKEVGGLSEPHRRMHSANSLFLLLQRLQELILHLLENKGLFLRGGISKGYSYVNEQYAVGTGVIEAYELESKTAIYPRIVVAENIVKDKDFAEPMGTICSYIYGIPTIFAEHKGVWSYDYMGVLIAQTMHTLQSSNAMGEAGLMLMYKFIDTHKRVIVEQIEGLSGTLGEDTKENEKIQKRLKKYQWLKEYHNDVVRESPPVLEIEKRGFSII